MKDQYFKEKSTFLGAEKFLSFSKAELCEAEPHLSMCRRRPAARAVKSFPSEERAETQDSSHRNLSQTTSLGLTQCLMVGLHRDHLPGLILSMAEYNEKDPIEIAMVVADVFPADR
ncbi:hypothetical protein GCK32_019863 [Trichostrongylus colubriformis]|uniref:Uncharacterized protein n=1 Tax=Trichostrongylus colubriformis TaxID=6319 RepID=A0AAN8FFE6_TRICO